MQLEEDGAMESLRTSNRMAGWQKWCSFGSRGRNIRAWYPLGYQWRWRLQLARLLGDCVGKIVSTLRSQGYTIQGEGWARDPHLTAHKHYWSKPANHGGDGCLLSIFSVKTVQKLHWNSILLSNLNLTRRGHCQAACRAAGPCSRAMRAWRPPLRTEQRRQGEPPEFHGPGNLKHRNIQIKGPGKKKWLVTHHLR